MARPKWIDNPSVFSPWQTKYLRRLLNKGTLTFTLGHSLPISLRRLEADGYVRVTKKRPYRMRGWYEVRLTAAGRNLFRLQT